MSVLLEIRNLSYQSYQRKILKSVSFDLRAGEIVALIGPNGSGKSSLLKIASGVHSSQNKNLMSAHAINLQDEPLNSLSVRERAKRVVYLSNELNSEFPLTGYEVVMMGHLVGKMYTPTLEDERHVLNIMKECFCEEFRDQSLLTLSGGEKQLISLARAFAQRSKVIFLDESLSQMDLNHQVQIGKLIQNKAKEGYGFVLVAHDLNMASEWATRCVLIHQGEIIGSGSVDEMLTEEFLGRLYPQMRLGFGVNPMTGRRKVFFGV